MLQSRTHADDARRCCVIDRSHEHALDSAPDLPLHLLLLRVGRDERILLRCLGRHGTPQGYRYDILVKMSRAISCTFIPTCHKQAGYFLLPNEIA